jgi:hypothetical protein
MKKVIVFRNNQFQIDEIEDGTKLNDVILSEPPHDTTHSIQLKNLIIIEWINPWTFSACDNARVLFKNIIISELNNTNIEQIFSLIINFKDYSIDELELLIENIKINKLTTEEETLIEKINELKKSKENLEKDIVLLSEIEESIKLLSLNTKIFMKHIKEFSKKTLYNERTSKKN